jgi:hypothetical protein
MRPADAEDEHRSRKATNPDYRSPTQVQARPARTSSTWAGALAGGPVFRVADQRRKRAAEKLTGSRHFDWPLRPPNL